MVKGSKILHSGSAILVVALALMVSAAPAFASGGGNPVSPTSQPFGQTYGQWGGNWWIWALGFPADHSPLIDPTGANCGLGQAGPVWFLAGTFTSNYVGKDVVGQAERTCTVPAGKAIFFPVLNAEGSTVEGNGSDYATLLAYVTGLMDGASVIRAEWDGTPIPGVTLGSAFRVHSPLMTFTLPANNVLLCPDPEHPKKYITCPAGPSAFVTDGYYVMLRPSAGQHTLHMYGEAPINAKSNFILDVTYHLTIAP